MNWEGETLRPTTCDCSQIEELIPNNTSILRYGFSCFMAGAPMHTVESPIRRGSSVTAVYCPRFGWRAIQSLGPQ
jgi:hypothetical protein